MSLTTELCWVRRMPGPSGGRPTSRRCYRAREVTATRRRQVAPALLPAVLIFGALFLVPMAGLLMESFRLFTPGRVGSVAGAPLSLNNYAELLNLPFLGLFLETFRVSVAATVVGLAVAYPLAWYIVRRFSARGRVMAIGFLITLILLSMLVRTYAIELTFGSVGILRPVLLAVGISPNSGWYIE